MRDIGPDMLRHLDAKLAAGEIDRATYEARRAETLKLIRRGHTVEYTLVERLARAGTGVGVALLGFVLLSLRLGSLGNGLAVVMLGAGSWIAYQRFRR